MEIACASGRAAEVLKHEAEEEMKTLFALLAALTVRTAAPAA
jgi:hypothetical protein